MSTVASLSGWVAAGIAGVLLLAVRRSGDARWAAVARACHELRGPLTAVRLGLSFGSRVGVLSPGRLRAIDAELGRAALALEDLESARSGRRMPVLRERRPVDLREVAADSVEAWRATAEAAGVELAVVPAPVAAIAWGDRLRLAQAVGNLLANAVEHGGRHVEVRTVSGTGWVGVEVGDDGDGLPDSLGRLIRGSDRRQGGRGRGLGIVSAIAVAHGGALRAEPAVTGTRLVLELPSAVRAGLAGRTNGRLQAVGSR